MSEAAVTMPNRSVRTQVEVAMNLLRRPQRRPERREHGQIIVLFALGLIVMVAGVALVVEGGNAYAQQRSVQNGADAAANAGADVIAQKLGGLTKTDTDVWTAVNAVRGLNTLDVGSAAYYTNVTGQPIDASGNATTAQLAMVVGSGGAIPPNGQGVHMTGNRVFGTHFGRVIGINGFKASAEALAIAGKAIGGKLLPVVFPVNISDCSGNGGLGSPRDQWPTSQPGTPHPIGQEFIVPLCKTGGGSFMVLDLDGIKNNCDYEVAHPKLLQFNSFPVLLDSDNGNNCAKPMVDAVNALQYQSVMIPICDQQCVTSGGNNAQYNVIGITAFVIDYMSDSNNQNNSLCQAHNNAEGQSMVTIAGNGSTSCIAGWFIRFITNGPVGAGPIGQDDALAIQLIK